MHSDHLLLVIVPYRNRAHHLQNFIHRVWRPLKRIHRKSRLIVAEQSADGRKFNRGAIVNCAIRYCRRWQPDRILIHDVDLIPCPRMLRQYVVMPLSCVAIAFGQRWGRYRGKNYFGGVVGIDNRLLWEVNGFPNAFWGWGGEDDELFRRIQNCNVQIDVPRCGTFYDQEQCKTWHEKKKQLLQNNSMCSNRRELRGICGGLRNVQFIVKNTNIKEKRIVFEIK